MKSALVSYVTCIATVVVPGALLLGIQCLFSGADGAASPGTGGIATAGGNEAIAVEEAIRIQSEAQRATQIAFFRQDLADIVTAAQSTTIDAGCAAICANAIYAERLEAAASRGDVDMMIENLTKLNEELERGAGWVGRDRLIEIARDRLRLAQTVKKSRELVLAATQYFVGREYDECDSLCNEHRNLVRNLDEEWDIQSFVKDTAEIGRLSQSLPRMREIDMLLGDNESPLQIRVKVAGEVFVKFSDADTRRSLKLLVESLLVSVLVEKDIPDVPAGLQEAWGANFGNLILGFYDADPSQQGIYRYWNSPSDRLSNQPPVVITTDLENTEFKKIRGKPRRPVFVSLAQSHNEHVRNLRNALESRRAWQDYADFCTKEEKGLSLIRDIARNTEGNNATVGVYPAEYAPLYENLSLAGEVLVANEILRLFNQIEPILNWHEPR